MSDGPGRPMTGGYSSFLIRWWRLSAGQCRIEVEHIQSGGRSRLTSPAEALAWMQAHSGACGPPATLPGEPVTPLMEPGTGDASPPAPAPDAPPRPGTPEIPG